MKKGHVLPKAWPPSTIFNKTWAPTNKTILNIGISLLKTPSTISFQMLSRVRVTCPRRWPIPPVWSTGSEQNLHFLCPVLHTIIFSSILAPQWNNDLNNKNVGNLQPLSCAHKVLFYFGMVRSPLIPEPCHTEQLQYSEQFYETNDSYDNHYLAIRP